MTTVTLSNVTKYFSRQDSPGASPGLGRERVPALVNVSLNVRDGETLCVLGPSGCGKSTLLKVMAGLIEPDTGQVLFDQVSINQIPLAERGVGIVFQNYALYPHMDAHDNIGFFDILRKQPEKIPERIERISTVMGVSIKHLLSRKPPTLSGGERQRVAVARCLARDPRLFLFDEPLSNLDTVLRVKTRVELKRLQREYRVTAVYVTHDQIEAMALADRLAIMKDGTIVQVGTFQQLYEMPVNVFVADFLGIPPMNLLEGRAYGDKWQGRGLAIRPIRPGLREGQAVLLGIRPEDVTLVPDGVRAQIELIEPIITDQVQIVYLKIGEHSCLARLPLDQPLEVGTSVEVHFPPEGLYLFDKKTGARIG
ncbi:MAG: ABC transporter ATP-binding protein [Chloroflexi bacterium]|nr:ABC transporter ATP-binding protein [Chloroflexota bacterium]